MKKLLAIVLVLGMASVASAAIVLDYDKVDLQPGGNMGVMLNDAGDSLAGFDLAVRVASGDLTLSSASVIYSGWTFSPIGPVAGNDDTLRRYSGAGIFGQAPLTMADGIFLGGMVVGGTEGVIELYCQGGVSTPLNGENLPAGVIDSITIVPEPITMSLLGFGGLALLRRRRA
ncbi:MAG: PEP-CTERM sorting domain-containing protein [Sedimentisphaerales bacterium]|nr:PEP-CTERM sorting domain-containing protein [Sedimentisphaerales bacterium]